MISSVPSEQLKRCGDELSQRVKSPSSIARFMTIVREHATAASLQQEREDATFAAADVRAVALDIGLLRANPRDADGPDGAHAQLGFETVAIHGIERDLREAARIAGSFQYEARAPRGAAAVVYTSKVLFPLWKPLVSGAPYLNELLPRIASDLPSVAIRCSALRQNRGVACLDTSAHATVHQSRHGRDPWHLSLPQRHGNRGGARSRQSGAADVGLR